MSIFLVSPLKAHLEREEKRRRRGKGEEKEQGKKKKREKNVRRGINGKKMRRRKISEGGEEEANVKEEGEESYKAWRWVKSYGGRSKIGKADEEKVDQSDKRWGG